MTRPAAGVIRRPLPTGLARFHAAQSRVYPRVVHEIRTGHKRSHWMWFVFPQLAGLARSETALYFGITGRREARAYLNDPALSRRLYQCTVGVLNHRHLMFGYPDDLKLRSCMTLFAQVAQDPTVLNAVLTKFYGGPDQATLDLLS